MKSFFLIPRLRGSIRSTLLSLAVLLSASLSHAQNSNPSYISDVAPSGAKASGSYTISIIYGVTPTIQINWSASGQSAVDSFGRTDLPAYWVQVVDPTTGVSGTSRPSPSLISLPTDGGVGYLYGVNYGDTLSVGEAAEIAVSIGGSYGLISENSSPLLYFTVTKDPAISETGSVGPPRYFSQPKDLVAEPVSATTGAFYENQVDLHINGPLPIEVRRTYASLNTSAMNEFGYGWLSGYSSYLIPSSDLSTIQAADTDGSVVTFRQKQGSTTVWSPSVADNPNLTNSSGGADNLYNSTITETGSGIGATYQWQLPDGSVRNYLVESFPIASGGVSFQRQRPYLTSCADNRGNSLTFSYGTVSTVNDYGRINLVKSSNGSSVSFTYDTEGHITQAAANDGRTVNYTYNLDYDLAQVQLPDGNTTSYQYGTNANGVSDHLITQVTKPDGSILQSTYDSSGRVLKQLATVDQSNPTTPAVTNTFDYSVPGQTTITDAYGNPTVYQYNASGLITLITDPLGQSITQSWYTSTGSGAYINSLQSVTDKRGLVTTYQYDAQGNIIETDVTGHLTGDSNIETATTTAIYNSLNLPVTVTDASGITTAFTYNDSKPNHKYLPTEIDTSKGGTVQNGGTLIRTDLLTYIDQSDANGFSNGLLASKTIASGSSDQAVTTYLYNSAGFLTQQTTNTSTGPAGTNDTDPNVVTNFTYTSRGELLTATDGDGRSIVYTYDGMSRPLTKTVKDENNNTLGVWTMTYTGTGQLSTTTGPRTAPANSTQRYYDNADRLEETVAALSQAKADGSGVTAGSYAFTDYVYDFSGNLVFEMDPLGNETTLTYDGNGQLLSKTLSGVGGSALRTEYFTYEPGGRVFSYTNPLGGVTRSFYTDTGQLSEQYNPDGSVLKWRYQTDGRLYQEILRNGSTWTTTYDDVNRIVTRTFSSPASSLSPLAFSLTDAYDRRGNLISHTDPDGFTKTATYDGLNRVKTATGPATTAGSAQQTTTFIYGASSKMLTTQNTLGEKTVTTSDALGRPVLTQVFAAGTTTNPIRTTSYVYSADNNSVTVTEGTGAGAISRTTWTDTIDQPVLTKLGDGTFTSNAYDLDGNLLSTTDALHQTTSYTYNGLNQLISQTLPDGTVTNFTSDAAGNPLTRTMADGTLTQAQTYDNAGRRLTEQLYSGSTVTRQYSYAYYPAGSPDAGLLETVTAPRDTITTTYDDLLRSSTVTTSPLSPPNPALNSTTTYSYDNLGRVTAVDQTETVNGEPTTVNISRTYDGYGQLLTETVNAGATTYANVTQTWDAAGRRATLNDASSSLPAPLFAYAHRADDLLAQVTTSFNSQPSTFNYSYGDNGLLTSRTNPFRSMTVDTRDPVGRILQQTQVVNSTAPLVENMTWRNNSTLNSYTATRTGTGAWNESRAYTYDARGQLLSEGFTLPSSPSPLASSLNYTFDGNNPGLGIRTDAKIGTGAPASWETSASADSLGRVDTDSLLAGTGQAVPPAAGTATDADHVNVFIDGVLQGLAAYNGSTWSMNLDLAAGTHTLTAKAVDASGLHTTTATRGFTVDAANPAQPAGAVTSAYDADGNVISRTWSLPASGGQGGVTQTLTWDAFDRLIQVSQRDTSQNGYDWTAIYDGLGRRISTTNQPVVNNTANGASTVTASIYDPQVEFLEIGVNVNGVQAYKVYGPDLNGRYGGLQGTGGLEATIMNGTGAATGIISDYFGNGVATISGGSVTWNTTRVGGYGPLPDSAAQPLTDATRLAQAIVWRGHYIDPTGFYNLGARYYEPTSGRFLSPDPKGQVASMSLYDFCNGDPVNFFDPDGRCRNAGLQPSDPSYFTVATGEAGNDGNAYPTDYGQNSADPNLPPAVPVTPTNIAAALLDGLGRMIASLSTIGEDQIDPNNSNAPLVNAGYNILEHKLGDQYNVPVDNPRFQLASAISAAIVAGSFVPGAPDVPVAAPTTAFTGFSDTEVAMLKNSLNTLQGAGYNTNQFAELIRADLPQGTSGMSLDGGAALGDQAFTSQAELNKTLEEELIHVQQKASGQASVFGPGTAQSLEDAANAQKKL
jgi:RHS repeat-associated protein